MRLTVEHLLYWIALLLAAAMRLFALGTMPLYPHEAQNAWLAWLVAMGLHVEQSAAPVSALYHVLQSFIFLPGFTSDAVARIAPALAGIALVALPWWWRSWLGRGVALSLAFLLAIDPWMVAFSRMADGSMLSIFFGMLALTAILQRPQDELSTQRWQTIAAIAMGLLLASGVLAWSFLFPIAAALFLVNDEWRAQLLGRQTFLWIGGTLLIAASGLFINPQLFGAVSRSLSLWLGQITSSADGYPFGWWIARLFIEQPLNLMAGIVGFWLIFKQIRADAENVDGAGEKWFLLLWLLWGIALGILPGRNPLALPMIGLPLLIAASFAINQLFSQDNHDFDWAEGRMFLGLLAVLFISGTIYALIAINNSSFDGTAWQPVALMVGLAILLTLLYGVWLDSRQAALMTGYLIGGALLVATLSAGWRLNYEENSMTPDGFYATTTHVDVRRLATDVATISAQRYGDATSMPVLVELNTEMQPDAVLGWYLHDSQVRWVPGATTGEGIQPPPLLITTQPDSSQAAIATTYMGSKYRVHYNWLPTDLNVNADGLMTAEGLGWRERIGAAWNNGWRARLRWLLYRESKTLMPVDEVTLWAQ